MKLYEIPQNSKILLTIVHGGDDPYENEQMCTFEHVDGMYSRIRTAEEDIVHLSAMAEVKEVDGHYELEES